jgi:hypothetical protein
MSVAVDLDPVTVRPCQWAGRVFGKLTVLGNIGDPDEKRLRCRSSCGTLVDTTRWNLRTGRTKDCPTCRVAARGYAPGTRFGVLTVVTAVSLGKMRVKCDCGKELEVRTSALHADRTRCVQDCTLRRNAPKWLGQTFGRLTVTNLAERPLYLICKCSCGKVIEAEASNLRSGRTKSCGSSGCRS